MTQQIILASDSAARKHLLDSVGLTYATIPARIDEEMVTAALLAEEAKPRDVADTLAEMKAAKVSTHHPEALVIGSDQVLATRSGLLGKASSKEHLFSQLTQLQGTTHQLFSAAVVYENTKPVWRHVGIARLRMRHLSETFLHGYIETYWNEIRHCVGGYRVEAEGLRLFSDIQGDPATIMGMPALPLVDFLALRGMIES